MADSATEMKALQVASAPAIEKRIYLIRERQVMLDEDLEQGVAMLSGVLRSDRAIAVTRSPIGFRIREGDE